MGALMKQAQNFTKEERQTYIGGSDIAAIMGQSRWKTPYTLWAEKTGKIDSTIKNNDAVDMGNRLEQFVADLFAEKTGKKVRRAPKTYKHPEYPFLVAHIDRLIVNSDELLECKTCSMYKLEEWENKIPKEYILQVQWYLGITGRKKGWIACLIGGQKFDYKPLEFDEELFTLMVNKAVKFWQMVQSDTPPLILPEDDETLGKVFLEHTEDLIENQEIEDRVSYLKEIEMHRDDYNKEIDEIKTELKAFIQDKMGILTDKYTVTWKSQTNSKLDMEHLRQDIPNLDDYYIKNTFRVLRIKKNKKEISNV